MTAPPVQVPVFTGDAIAPAPDQTDPLAPDADAPFGYMLDAATGEKRPKKRPGRQPRGAERPAPTVDPLTGNPPTLDELKAAGARPGGEDRSPDDTPRRPRGKAARARAKAKEEPEPLPPFRAGPIAKGMNKLYAKAGKILRVLDPVLGEAILACTRKESEDDMTVGEAWEDVAKVNPRIRGFLLKALEGSAWSSLFMAHAPIALALLMKENIRKHIPFGRLLVALLEPEDDGSPSDVSAAFGGIQGIDIEQMMGTVMSAMSTTFSDMAPRGGSAPRQPSNGTLVVVESEPGEGG